MGFLLKAKGEKEKALQSMAKASDLGIQADEGFTQVLLDENIVDAARQ